MQRRSSPQTPAPAHVCAGFGRSAVGMTTAGHAGPIPFAADAACTRAPSRKSSVRTCASGGEALGADVWCPPSARCASSKWNQISASCARRARMISMLTCELAPSSLDRARGRLFGDPPVGAPLPSVGDGRCQKRHIRRVLGARLPWQDVSPSGDRNDLRLRLAGALCGAVSRRQH